MSRNDGYWLCGVKGAEVCVSTDVEKIDRRRREYQSHALQKVRDTLSKMPNLQRGMLDVYELRICREFVLDQIMPALHSDDIPMRIDAVLILIQIDEERGIRERLGLFQDAESRVLAALKLCGHGLPEIGCEEAQILAELFSSAVTTLRRNILDAMLYRLPKASLGRLEQIFLLLSDDEKKYAIWRLAMHTVDFRIFDFALHGPLSENPELMIRLSKNPVPAFQKAAKSRLLGLNFSPPVNAISPFLDDAMSLGVLSNTEIDLIRRKVEEARSEIGNRWLCLKQAHDIAVFMDLSQRLASIARY